MANLAELFAPPASCVVIEQRTGLDGWPCWRVSIHSNGQARLHTDYDTHSAALAAAKAITEARDLLLFDICGEEY